MILHSAPQGSPEWLQSRAGLITASTFVEIRKRLKSGPNKGDFSSEARALAFRLGIERISGQPLGEGFTNWAMKWGQEQEAPAREELELTAGVLIQEAGFISTDDGKFGASADGFIGHDGGVEIKCLRDPSRIQKVLMAGDISEFMDQIQGGMWITGRKYWLFALYVPDLAPIGRQLTWRRVERDDNYIDALELDLIAFERLVSENEAALRNFKEAA